MSESRPTLPVSFFVAVLAVSACGDSDPVTTERTPDGPSHSLLQVSYLSMEPRLPPPPLDTPDERSGWPEVGSTVTWIAHVENRGPNTALAVPWSWTDDGERVDSGIVDLPPGMTRVEVPWTWEPTRHRLRFEIHPSDDVDRGGVEDNHAEVASDALTVGFVVEMGTHGRLDDFPWNGFERWAYEQIELYNRILRAGTRVDGETVRDRLRLERITVLPDGSPYPVDIDTDLFWFFPSAFPDARFLQAQSTDVQVENQVIVLHELLHQRGLTDLYAYEVLHGTANGSHIGIVENGIPIAGTSVLPLSSNRAWRPALNGIMGNQYGPGGTLTAHSVFGLNARAGRRTPRDLDAAGNRLNGFQHHPYVNLLPENPRLRVVDASNGEGLSDAIVEIFVDHGATSYQDVYAADPDFTLTPDEDGVVTLPSNLLDGTPTSVFPKSWTVILRIRTVQARDYYFLPGTALNIHAMYGNTGPITVRVSLIPW